jgi:hypothetical protein
MTKWWNPGIARIWLPGMQPNIALDILSMVLVLTVINASVANIWVWVWTHSKLSTSIVSAWTIVFLHSLFYALSWMNCKHFMPYTHLRDKHFEAILVVRFCHTIIVLNVHIYLLS